MDELLNTELKKDREKLIGLWDSQLKSIKLQLNVNDSDIYSQEYADFEYGHFRSNKKLVIITKRGVPLGLIYNSSSLPKYNLRLISDERILNVLKIDESWFNLMVMVQNALDSGMCINVDGNSGNKYDSRFINNVKFHSDLDPDEYSYVRSLDSYILLESDDGIELPDVLHDWELQSIPESIIINDQVFYCRKEMFKRINEEAPFFCFTNMIRYACANIDFDDSIVQLWLSYFLSGDVFSTNGRNIVNKKTLLGHKRFELTFAYLRCRLKFNLDDTDMKVLAEGARFLMSDPLYNAYSVKSYFGDLNQYLFAKSNGPFANYSINKIDRTSFKLERGVKDWGGFNRCNNIDNEVIVNAVNKLNQFGLFMNAELMKNLISAPISKRNLIRGKINRMILGLIGYSGTHGPTAFINQYYGTRSLGSNTDPNFRKEIISYVERFMVAGVNRYPYVTNDKHNMPRLDVLFKGGTSSASSTFNHKNIDIDVSYSTPFYDDTIIKLGRKGVFKDLINPEKGYRVTTRVKTSFKSKSATIITNPEDFTKFRLSDLRLTVNAGSRLVKGTRAKRIITPTYGSIYNTALLTVLPAVRLLSYKDRDGLALSLEGAVGTTYTGALAHVVIAPMLAALCNDPSYFIAAFDFSQFDTSQFGDISIAHAEGLRKYASRYGELVKPIADDDVIDLLTADQRVLLEIQALAFERPLLYKGNGVVLYADGVKSGELSTQLRNTFTNQPHTVLTLDRYNSMSNGRKIKLVHENIIGDDKYLVFRTVDKKPADEDIYRRLIDVAADVATENHMIISRKRCVVGNKIGEHIKLYASGGCLIQDVFLDVFTSEKNSFVPQNYIQRLTIAYDIYMTMLIRFADVEPLMKLFVSDLSCMIGVKSGDFNFIPNIGVISAIGGPEILLSAPEIRGMGRYAFNKYVSNVDDESLKWYTVINSLYETMTSGGGKRIFEKIVKMNIRKKEGSVIGDFISPIWVNHFKRKRSVMPNNVKNRRGYTRVLRYAPENVEEVLLDQIISTLDEPVIGFIDNDNVLKKMFIHKQLSQGRNAAYVFKGWFKTFESRGSDGLDSPYLAADEGVKNVHKIIGLADFNANLTEPATKLEAILKRNAGSYPSYISGNVLMSLMSDLDPTYWSEVMEILDFSTSLGELVIEFVSKTLYQYLSSKVDFAGSIYDNTSRTYNISDQTIKERVDVDSRVSYHTSMGLRLEAMKVVVYLARLGVSARAVLSADINYLNITVDGNPEI